MLKLPPGPISWVYRKGGCQQILAKLMVFAPTVIHSTDRCNRGKLEAQVQGSPRHGPALILGPRLSSRMRAQLRHSRHIPRPEPSPHLPSQRSLALALRPPLRALAPVGRTLQTRLAIMFQSPPVVTSILGLVRQPHHRHRCVEEMPHLLPLPLHPHRPLLPHHKQASSTSDF